MDSSANHARVIAVSIKRKLFHAAFQAETHDVGKAHGFQDYSPDRVSAFVSSMPASLSALYARAPLALSAARNFIPYKANRRF